MFESIMKFFNKLRKKEEKVAPNSKEAAKERLHLVHMQDRANVSADFLELMKQEIIEVIKKYIDIDEGAIDVRLTNKENEDGTNGAPALYANIPILNIKNEARKIDKPEEKNKQQEKKTENENKKSTEEQAETKEEIKEEKNETKSEKNIDKEENKDDTMMQKEENEEENMDLENKDEVAEEKETKEKLNQKK